MHGGVGSDVALVLALLLVVAVVAAAVRVVRLPYTVALVLAGLALAIAPGTPRLALTPDVILLVFLPVLLFEASYQLDAGELRANLRPIVVLALPGVAVTAFLVAGALAWLGGLHWQTALLFGAIVAATDPVAVLAVFRDLGAPKRLSTIVEAESLFNDGSALVFFRVILAAVVGGAFNPAAAATDFVVVSAGGLAVGAAAGILGTVAIRRFDDALLETTVTLIVAYGSYLLAEELHVSGVLAVVVAGLVVGRDAPRAMTPSTQLAVRFVWQFLGFVANSLIFLLVGLELRPFEEVLGARGLAALIWPLLVAIVAVVVVRVLVVWLSATVLRRPGDRLPRPWRAVLVWGGLRGAVALAMALSLPATLADGSPFADRELLFLLTFGVILFTLLVQATTMSPLLRRLGLDAGAGHAEYERALGRLRAGRAAIAELDGMVAQHRIGPDTAAAWRAALSARLEGLSESLHELGHSNAFLAVEQARRVRRHLLHVERLTLAELREHGDLSDAVARELTAEVDEELTRIEAEDWEPEVPAHVHAPASAGAAAPARPAGGR